MNSENLRHGSRKVKIVAIGTLKGGVGKSTTVVSIASVLASKGKKVLVLDADPQANTTSAFALDETVAGYKGTLDLFENRQINPTEIIQRTNVDGVDIIGSTILLTGTERKFSTMAYAEQQLDRYISRNLEVFNKYDYIICDTNPSMSKTNQNVFVTSDKIICVTDVGISSFKGLELFDYLLDELADEAGLELQIDGVIVNRCKNTTNLTKEYIEYLKSKDLTKDIVLDTHIRESVKIAEAELEQRPVVEYAPQSSVANDFKKLVDELIDKNIL